MKTVNSFYDFREKNGYFIPYVKVGYYNEIIEDIKVSALFDLDDAKLEIRQLFNKKNETPPYIDQSKIPIRY